MSAVALAYASDAGAEPSFSDRVAQLLNRVDYRLIETDEEREAVARLRYDAYLREGAISPNATKTFSDPYDDSKNARIFGLFVDDELVSSIRIHVGSKQTPVFPSLSVFSDLLAPELEAGKTIIDPTRFVTDRNFSRLHAGLPHVTLRLCWLAAEHFDAEHFIVAVRAEHQAFYRRVFDHRPICGPRPYPLLSKPITLMTVDYQEVEARVQRRYPFFRSTYFERRMLFDGHLPMPQVAVHRRPTLRVRPGLQVAAQAG